MSNIILFPTHEDYCRTCESHDDLYETCTNEKFINNMYDVHCVLGYCPYRKERKTMET